MPRENYLQERLAELGKTSRLGLVVFETKWSGSSDMMRTIVTSLVQENKDRLTLISCDLDELPNLAAEFQICELPTIMFFLHGKVQTRLDGLIPKHELASQIETLLA